MPNYLNSAEASAETVHRDALETLGFDNVDTDVGKYYVKTTSLSSLIPKLRAMLTEEQWERYVALMFWHGDPNAPTKVTNDSRFGLEYLKAFATASDLIHVRALMQTLRKEKP